MLCITFWGCAFHLCRRYFSDLKISHKKVFSHVMISVCGMVGVIFTLIFLSMSYNKENIDQLIFDVYILGGLCVFVSGYISEIFTRADDLDPAMFLHHVSTVILVTFFFWNDTGPNVSSSTYASMIQLLAINGFGAAFDASSRFVFALYQVWSKTKPNRMVTILSMTIWYQLFFKIASHLWWFTTFGLFVSQSRIQGYALYVLPVIAFFFLCIEYYQSYIMYVIRSRLIAKSKDIAGRDDMTVSVNSNGIQSDGKIGLNSSQICIETTKDHEKVTIESYGNINSCLENTSDKS
eukprot:Awhi_evm1s13258